MLSERTMNYLTVILNIALSPYNVTIYSDTDFSGFKAS